LPLFAFILPYKLQFFLLNLSRPSFFIFFLIFFSPTDIGLGSSCWSWLTS
jgi:hypothetical protein